MLAAAKGNPSPIPPERLGAWWRAAGAAPSRIAADYYRFQLLTGCRGGEIYGDKRHGYAPIKVGNVDCELGKLVLRDTKNRSDHKLLLSRQALEIAARSCSGRKPEDPLFPIVDARKTLAWINVQAGTTVQGHGLRATFASVAEELVSGGALKRMLNHDTGGDVTLGHYVGKSEGQLRAAWQTVADFIDAEAAKEAQQTPALPVRSSLRVQRVGTAPAVAPRRRPSRRAQVPSSEGPSSQSISERVLFVGDQRRPLFWEGSSKKDFKAFPVAVQKDMGVALFIAQLGRTAGSAKPWKGLGSGVYELVEDHRGDTFRAVYVVQVADAVHVLHAFQKKSKAGIATPQPDVELVEKRLKAVLARYRLGRG